jgi:HEAT repeat protein
MDAAATAAVPLFSTLLEDTAPTTIDDVPRSWALKAVALLGPPARELTPRIAEILKAADTSPLDRLLCLEALARIGPAHGQSLGAVVAVLESGRAGASSAGPDAAAANLELRTAAAGVLSLFGKSASPAIPALLRAARSEHEPLRRAATTTLGSAGDATLIEPLADILLFDDSPAVQDAAAVSLSQLGPQTADIFEQLLTDADPTTRARAADGLRRLGPTARASLPAVVKVLTDEAPEVQITAAEAVWSISGEVPQPLDTAARLLSEPTREVRMRAHRLLVDMGRTTHDPALIGRLQTLSESRDPRVRQAAFLALRELQQAVQ